MNQEQRHHRNERLLWSLVVLTLLVIPGVAFIISSFSAIYKAGFTDINVFMLVIGVLMCVLSVFLLSLLNNRNNY